MQYLINGLVVILLAGVSACGGSGGGGNSTPEISGKLTFDRVPHDSFSGLDFPNTVQAPVRGATVDLLNASGTFLQNTVSDSEGNYRFEVSAQASYIIRVRAELKKEDAAPTWNFSVVDNTQAKALYTMQSTSQAVAAQSVTLNLNAASGWDVSGYTGSRVAAPFAILDSIYRAKELVLSADPNVVFPALLVNWSVNNKAVPGDNTKGEITTSSFDTEQIYILGDALGDTDEYDSHIITHEWGHYLEQYFSRTDTLGGGHRLTDKQDPRVALGEGFGNAFSGMATGQAIYRDSFFGPQQNTGNSFDLEANPVINAAGWYSEASVQSLLYDIYDTTNEGSDSVSLGFTPIFKALINGEKTTKAFTTIFSLVNQIKKESPANVNAINNLLISQNIQVDDDFATTEVTNDGGDPGSLPLYQPLTINAGNLAVCTNNTNGEFNKLGNRRYIQFEVPVTGNYTVSATAQSVNDDPDIVVYKQGEVLFIGHEAGDESKTLNLGAGIYLIDVSDKANTDNSGGGKNVCSDISVSSI